MKPTLQIGALAKVSALDYVQRFLFGGIVTACTGLVAQLCGPAIGGLFLAFPAILPASLTLLERKHGRKHGRQLAVADARGARLGAGALIVFGAVGVTLAPQYGCLTTLVVATGAWLATSVTLWVVWYGLRRCDPQS